MPTLTLLWEGIETGRNLVAEALVHEGRRANVATLQFGVAFEPLPSYTPGVPILTRTSRISSAPIAFT